MPKRKATSSSGKKKKPALDWRVPIFYWRGTLTDKTWQGTWVASEFGLPSDDDFKASENTFKLECSEMLSLVGNQVVAAHRMHTLSGTPGGLQ